MFDRALVTRFRASKGIRPLNYIKTHFQVLATMADEKSLMNVTDALERNQDCDPACLAVCLKSSDICKLLFAALQTKMHYVLYTNEIEKQLDQLEYLDFKLEEVDAFNLLMQREASQIKNIGVIHLCSIFSNVGNQNGSIFLVLLLLPDKNHWCC